MDDGSDASVDAIDSGESGCSDSDEWCAGECGELVRDSGSVDVGWVDYEDASWCDSGLYCGADVYVLLVAV